MTRPIDHELVEVFPMAVRAAIEGKCGFRYGQIVYALRYFVTLAYNVAEVMPVDLCRALHLRCGSASYHEGGQKLKALIKKRHSPPGHAIPTV